MRHFYALFFALSARTLPVSRRPSRPKSSDHRGACPCSRPAAAEPVRGIRTVTREPQSVAGTPRGSCPERPHSALCLECLGVLRSATLVHRHVRSGLPSLVRGAGAGRFGLRSAVRGSRFRSGNRRALYPKYRKWTGLSDTLRERRVRRFLFEPMVTAPSRADDRAAPMSWWASPFHPPLNLQLVTASPLCGNRLPEVVPHFTCTTWHLPLT
jgi:hypothetical protein